MGCELIQSWMKSNIREALWLLFLSLTQNNGQRHLGEVKRLLDLQVSVSEPIMKETACRSIQLCLNGAELREEGETHRELNSLSPIPTSTARPTSSLTSTNCWRLSVQTHGVLGLFTLNCDI